jgi:hypothetical protein
LSRLPVPSIRVQKGVALANVIAQIGIMTTGVTVRVTASGLGCETWPQCNEASFVPVPGAAPALHQAVERGGVVKRRVGTVLRWRVTQAAAAHAGNRQRLCTALAGPAQIRQLTATCVAQRQALTAGGAAQRALRRQQPGEQGVETFVNFGVHVRLTQWRSRLF